jgi:lysophospholipase L1-like esterase
VLVLSLPDMNRLWEAGRRNNAALRAWSYGVCPALLANAASTAEPDTRRRAAFRDRLDAYNDALAGACKAYGRRCRYDGGAVHRVRFGLEQVNILDFFHPNASGQQALAEATWPSRFNW